jgi:hypothetical protein
MNLRPKILVTADALGFFEQKFFGTLWTSEFDFEVLDINKTYDIKQCVIWIDQYDTGNWIQPYRDAGYKIIYDYLWDSNVHDPAEILDNVLKLRAKNWIWISEYYMYNYFGYKNQIQPADTNYFMLMLMNLRRAHRSQALISMEKFLSSSLYSYVSQGIMLHDDFVRDDTTSIDDRFFNPQWYSQTCFSMVLETSVDNQLFISEKSFKPLAHRHPFLIYGTPGTLAHLHSLGFLTFDHIIDETYDSEPNTSVYSPNIHGDYITSGNRLSRLVQLLDTLYQEFKSDRCLFADSESQHRLDHNHQLFYDSALINQMWQQEIVGVIKEFANA